jgi:hypothetical protein
VGGWGEGQPALELVSSLDDLEIWVFIFILLFFTFSFFIFSDMVVGIGVCVRVWNATP